MDSYIALLSENLTLFYSIIFVFSVSIGSFLNVVIYRLPIMLDNEWKQDCVEYLKLKNYALNSSKFNLSSPSSTCPKCKSKIKAWQNIPILSFMILGGKCANCKTKISYRYPFIELLTGLLALIIASHFGVSLEALLALLLTYNLIILSMIDLDHKILPDNIVLPLLWIGLIVNQYGIFTSSLDALWGAIVGYLSLWTVFQVFKLITGKEGMGFGDFKLFSCLGAWLGVSKLLPIILISSIVGTIVGLIIIVKQGKDKNLQIPFGPYLAIAGWLTLLWGDSFMSLIIGTQRF